VSDRTSPQPAVLVKDLRVQFNAAPVLDGISLRVHQGETVALLGANGSGKTTLVKAMMGLVPVTGGHITLYGSDVTNRRAVQWSRIGYVPQRINASAVMTVTAAEVVASGLLNERRIFPASGGHDRVLKALNQVGLAGRAGESVHVFSGGQQQRVLIARALVRRPDMLIIDEPMSGIDRQSQKALAITVRELQLKGTTIVVVLHDLGVLAPMIHRVVILDHGRVTHDGPLAAQSPSPDAKEHFHGADGMPPPPRPSVGLSAGWQGHP